MNGGVRGEWVCVCRGRRVVREGERVDLPLFRDLTAAPPSVTSSSLSNLVKKCKKNKTYYE